MTADTRCPAERARRTDWFAIKWWGNPGTPVRCSLPIGHDGLHHAALHDHDNTDRFYVW